MDHRTIAATALAAASLALAAPADAAGNQGRGRVILLTPLEFLNVEDLSFGSVVAPSSGSGTVTINPVDSSMTYSNIVPMPGSTPQRGWLLGAASPGETVTVTASLPTKLHLDGNTSQPFVPVNLFLDHLKNGSGQYFYVATTAHTFSVFVGGTVTIASGTTTGTYSNTFDITAVYP